MPDQAVLQYSLPIMRWATRRTDPYGTRCSWGGLSGSAVLTAEGPGPKLVLVDCPACGHDNRALAKFCDACGQLLEPGEALGQPDPRSYTPAPLAEKMRRQRPSEGERRTVTDGQRGLTHLLSHPGLPPRRSGTSRSLEPTGRVGYETAWTTGGSCTRR